MSAKPLMTLPASSAMQLIRPFRKMLPGKYLRRNEIRVELSEHVNQARHMILKLILIVCLPKK